MDFSLFGNAVIAPITKSRAAIQCSVLLANSVSLQTEIRIWKYYF